MEIRELAVPHSWEITPDLHADDRGVFLESYRGDRLAAATGRGFSPVQGNVSVSRFGVARGIHYADVGVGQGKYVTVVAGSVVDYVVDIRVGSPSFGSVAMVELSAENRKAVFIAEGLGHLFVATSESATVSYLVNAVYTPGVEHGVSPLDPALGLALPVGRSALVLSAQDEAAPTLDEAAEAGALPTWDACLALYKERS